MKVVIVGGVAGGATAAARIRRLDEHAQTETDIVVERDGKGLLHCSHVCWPAD